VRKIIGRAMKRSKRLWILRGIFDQPFNSMAVQQAGQTKRMIKMKIKYLQQFAKMHKKLSIR
jgi:hypothetical protein